MLRGDRRVLGHQERAAHREAGIVVRFRDTGFLQQLHRAAAGADKDVFGVNSLRFPALHILNRYVQELSALRLKSVTSEEVCRVKWLFFFRLPISWRVISP